MMIPAAAPEDAGFEVVDDPPPPPPRRKPAAVVDEEDAPRRPAKPRVADDEDDRPRKKARPAVVDDEEDEDDRPRKKKGPAKKKSRTLLYVLGGVGLLVLVGGGVTAAVLMSGKGSGGLGGLGGLTGPSWTTFDDPNGTFTTQFPGDKPVPETIETFGGAGQDANAAQQMQKMGFTFDGWSSTYQGRKYGVGYLTVPPAFAALLKPEMINQKEGPGRPNFGPRGGGTIVSDQPITTSGQPARQILAKRADGSMTLGRMLIANGRLYILVVIAPTGESLTETDSLAGEFFDKFQLKAAPAEKK
jgi:hypothetical protein